MLIPRGTKLAAIMKRLKVALADISFAQLSMAISGNFKHQIHDQA